MLASGNRMRRSAEFTAVMRRSRRARRGTLIMHCGRTGAIEGLPRVGFIVSRAVGDAVVRNRVRRRLRHAMRERVECLAPDSAVVIRVLPPAATADWQELCADLDAVLADLRRKR